MESVLIVDDEEEIVELLDFYMKNNGYNTYKAFNGKEAIKVFEEESIDIIILDIMMPECDGKEVLKRVRAKSGVPILFLSAKGEDIDKIDGLFLGADDYIAKPFNPMEIVARVKALLRRSAVFNNKEEKKDHIINVANLRLDEMACKLYKDNLEVELTSVEYKLIAFFIKNQNRVFTKGQLYENVWQESYLGDERIIMVYISKLREKIEINPKEPKFIKTIRGLGYIFEGN
ncbi:DNA-binding response regulator, OmpR family, contains REC and winged-helix (wHTH) domain [Clostridium cavendishii DSM 21758]|uniref:Stage 0 sporulation protein A homolog n=1 Tax=Clostridium cavendishii DSM 21758 TaxID=1121302 RepID=A0A1M6HRA9_9CLOT|nr:response regulator transcription factor [Clostridium cavendishii]SHJ24738.1 DNA-binding response regulator, OmpR family, contains REC and winged-helix (wHTH) domain [Clostridium cavendishii DSM 21758]